MISIIKTKYLTINIQCSTNPCVDDIKRLNVAIAVKCHINLCTIFRVHAQYILTVYTFLTKTVVISAEARIRAVYDKPGF